MHKHFTTAIAHTCKNCGKQFYMTGNTRGKFCSLACYHEYKARPDSEYRINARIKLTCQECGKEFERIRSQVRGTTHYCSRECAGNVSGGAIKRRERKPSVDAQCKVCGKPYKRRASHPDQKYCCRECAMKDRSEWMSGAGNANYRHGQSRASAAGVAKNNYEMKCIICGFDVFVDIHHIHPIAKGGTNAPDNLAVLCPNHHRMADRGLISEDDLRDIAHKARKT